MKQPTVEEVQRTKEAVEYLQGEESRAAGALEQMRKVLGTKSLNEARERLSSLKDEVTQLEDEHGRLAADFWKDYGNCVRQAQDRRPPGGLTQGG